MRSPDDHLRIQTNASRNVHSDASCQLPGSEPGSASHPLRRLMRHPTATIAAAVRARLQTSPTMSSATMRSATMSSEGGLSERNRPGRRPQTLPKARNVRLDRRPSPALSTSESRTQGLMPTLLPRRLTGIALSVSVGLLGSGCVATQGIRADSAASTPSPIFNATYSEDADVAFVTEAKMSLTRGSRQVDFASESASRRTRDMADWVVRSKDNSNMPFAIIDKVNARVYVFTANGQLEGSAPVLLGLAKGDYSVPGIGNKPLSSIPPSERTTPAGRFVARMGRNAKGKDILWLDYEQALSMHPVVKGTARDRRAERLASPTPADNRISFGCINVPVEFFHEKIQSKFAGAAGIVYILPETDQFKAS